MIKPMQTTVLPRINAQQATTMQSTVLPAQTGTTTGIDITSLLNLMVTMMIIGMMMRMMSGMMTTMTAPS